MSFVHDELTERIIGCAMSVHSALGPGFVEQTYEAALCIELAEHQIKSVDRLIGLHRAQVLAYARALGLQVGLLLNFNSEVLRTGIQRVDLPTSRPHRLP